MEWLEVCSTVLDMEQFTFLLVLVWNVWNRRNRWTHSNQMIPARLVSEYAKIVMADFQSASENPVSNEWDRVIIEGDAWGIVDRLRAGELDESVAATYLTEAWTTLKREAGMAVQFVPREANQAAHELARFCCNGPNEFNFVHAIPPCISDIVINDAIYG
ncbi:hypothetical protein V6N11_021796 [Hibiscus sabdariffa]|uniref:RNase H type-1 domain-containing protein n=1 Tax=Hibiscus sabdariffa TaxID=183260 RepID=A0ABR2THN1_9ROSI